MYQCDCCGCYADAGELRGGVCDDCREEEERLEERRDWTRKMLARNIAEQVDGQLVLDYGSC